MAGLGARLFPAFSKLTAAQVNGYLMDQTIMRFASTAARDAAFGGAGEPTLAEGMTCYLDDTNQIQSYNGSAWVIAASTSAPTVSLYNTTDQNLVGSSYNNLTFNAEKWDTNNMHSTTTNTSRITIPTGWAGYYLLTASIAVSTSQASVTFLKNGTDRTYGDFTPSGGQATCTAVEYFAAGDYVEVTCYCLANLTVYGNASIGSTSAPLFQATWLRA